MEWIGSFLLKMSMLTLWQMYTLPAQTVLHAQKETAIFSVVDTGNYDLIAPENVMHWRYDRKEGKKNGENHRKMFNVSDLDQVDAKEGKDGWEKGRREVGILVPAALVLQAPLTSAQPAQWCSPLPISTDGLLGASRSRKKYKTTVRLLLSFLLHTSHSPWPSQRNLWQVKPSRYWLPSRLSEKNRRDELEWICFTDTVHLCLEYICFNHRISVSQLFMIIPRTHSTPATE